jgi:hypothetical protein
MTDHSDVLGTYKGHPIVDTKLILRKTGDGLSNPMPVAPVVLELGSTGFIANRYVVVKHQYESNRNDAGDIVSVTLVQVIESTGAALADSKLIGAAIQKNVDAIREAEALAKNQLTLDIVDADVTDLDAARKDRDAAKKGAK